MRNIWCDDNNNDNRTTDLKKAGGCYFVSTKSIIIYFNLYFATLAHIIFNCAKTGISETSLHSLKQSILFTCYKSQKCFCWISKKFDTHLHITVYVDLKACTYTYTSIHVLLMSNTMPNMSLPFAICQLTQNSLKCTAFNWKCNRSIC